MEAKKDRENKEKLLEDKTNFNNFSKKNKRDKLKKKNYTLSIEKESEKKEDMIVMTMLKNSNTKVYVKVLYKNKKDKTM